MQAMLYQSPGWNTFRAVSTVFSFRKEEIETSPPSVKNLSNLEPRTGATEMAR